MKKREIFLAKMSISNKQQETEKLQEFIVNEQESLRTRQADFMTDVESVKYFVRDLQARADDEKTKADEERKKSKIKQKQIA